MGVFWRNWSVNASTYSVFGPMLDRNWSFIDLLTKSARPTF